MAEYRIREAFYEKGGDGRKRRGFLAERRTRFLGLIPIWWPVDNSEWRPSQEGAMRDLHNHIELNKPLSRPRVFCD